MLSYMLPAVEEKTSPRNNLNLNLNLNGNGNLGDKRDCDEPTNSTKLINFERASVLKPTLVQQQQQNGDNSQSIIRISNTISHVQKLDNTMDNHNVGQHSILSTTTSDNDSKKVKLTKIGNQKTAPLKRVSFGSSKGSMVETLVFETPTPLPEHAEREFSFAPEVAANTGGSTTTTITTNNKQSNLNNINNCLDDSGIEMQEELERSKVRVTFFQSGKPQQISPPDNPHNLGFFDTTDISLLGDYLINDSTVSSDTNNMTAATAVQPTYDRQIREAFFEHMGKMGLNNNYRPTSSSSALSLNYDVKTTESGWDNPFRPGGDLSREADEIVNMIKGGKPITPTGDVSFSNGAAQLNNHTTENGTAVVDGATKTDVSQLQSSQNGLKSPQKNGDKKNGDNNTQSPQTQISNQVIPGPQSASHVVIDDKKKKKCTCCVIQ